MAGSFNVLLPGPPRPTARAVIRESYSATLFPNVDPNALATSKDVSAIRRLVARKINEEKDLHSMRLSDVTTEDIAYLTPGPGATALQIHYWNLLTTQGGPLWVSDEDLAVALDLDEQTEDNDTPTDLGSQIFYVRSWALTVDELRDIGKNWQEDGLCPPEMRGWMAAVNHVKQGDKVVYLRYVGTAMGPTTARQRFTEDISGRTAGFLMRFMDALQQLNPSAYERARVFLFNKATLNPLNPVVAQRYRDEREVQIIAFFGYHNLLNQDPGGSHFTPYTWDFEYGVMFSQLRTNFFRNIQQHAEEPSQAMINRVGAWRRAVEEFAIVNPTGTGAAAHPLSPTYLDTMFRQAVPCTVKGVTVLAIAGKDVTRTAYLSSTHLPFLGTTTEAPESEGGEITRDTLARLQHHENRMTLATRWQSCDVDPVFLAFADLFPFLRHKEIWACIALLREWVMAIAPLVLVTMGRQPSAALAAHFIHPYGLPERDYISSVGLPFIATFADPIWTETSDTPPPGYEVLVIPHLDPGYVKYQQGPDARLAVLRVIDATWQLTIAVSYYAMQHLILETSLMNRPLLVSSLHTFASMSSPAPEIRALHTVLARAKQELQQVLDDQRAGRPAPPKSVRDGERDKENAEERVLRAGYALGAPYSPERIQQITAMWRRNYPDVQMHIRSRSDEEYSWKQWASSRAEGTSFLMASLHAAGTIFGGVSDPVRQVLRQMAPPGVTDDFWMTDPVQRQAALDAKGAQMRAGITPEGRARMFSAESQRARALARYLRSPTDSIVEHLSVMEGREVMVWGNGMVPVYWTDPQSIVNYTIILRAPKSAIGVDDNDLRRFLVFLPQGIGLRNETGTYYALQRNSPMMHGIFRQDQFLTHELGPVIQKMWHLERQRIAPTTPSMFTPATLPGKAPPARRPKEPSQTPPAPNDALFLVCGWLDQVFPNGGYFHTGDPNWTFKLYPADVDVPSLDIESLWSTWRDYMRSQQNHPYSATLAGWQGVTANVTKLLACVATCRRILAEGRKQRHGGTQSKWVRIAGRSGNGQGPSAPSSSSAAPPSPPGPSSASKKRPLSQHGSPTKPKPWRY
ncbi:hypothetical protein HDU89_008619 [Geranomyces variabilis]|nr:hypothetical protein HDU89_008619 [Geranomyces variabilis]